MNASKSEKNFNEWKQLAFFLTLSASKQASNTIESV